MIIRRSKKFTVQMREYETYSFGADVEMSHHDLGVTDEELLGMTPEEFEKLREDLIAAVLSELFVQLRDELDRTAALVENRHSFVRRGNQLIEVMSDGFTQAPSQQPTTNSPKPKPRAIVRKR